MSAGQIEHITNTESAIRAALDALIPLYRGLNPEGCSTYLRFQSDIVPILKKDIDNEGKIELLIAQGDEITQRKIITSTFKYLMRHDFLFVPKSKSEEAIEEALKDFFSCFPGYELTKNKPRWNKVYEMVHTVRLLRENFIFQEEKGSKKFSQIRELFRKKDNEKPTYDTVKNIYSSDDKQMEEEREKLILDFISDLKRGKYR